MKKIFKQLVKLFPNSTVTIQHSIHTYRDGENYKVYIDCIPKIWEYNWSPEYKTLKELDINLAIKITDYKKVYYDKK